MNKNKRKAVVAGLVCLDITPIFGRQKADDIREILKPGKLINVENAQIYPGGSVSNTGLAMKKMGIDTCLIGKIGDDPFGDIVHSPYQDYDAHQDLVRVPGEATGYTMVLAVPGIDRIFLHNSGINDTFGNSDIADSRLAYADLFHLGYPPALKQLYQNEGEELVEVFRRADQKGIITSLDMMPIEAGSPASEENWLAILQKVLPFIDYFVPSFEELCYIVDPEKYRWLIEKAGHGDITEVLSVSEDVCPLVFKAMDMGAANVLLKCGVPGFYYCMGDQEAYKKIEARLEQKMDTWYGAEGFEYSYKPEKVRSGAGAGDTTIAAFLTAMLQGYSLQQSIQAASATGTSCVETYDVLSGVRPIPEQLKRIGDGLEKQGVFR